MNPKLQIYAEVNAQVDAATSEWNRVALAAWRRLREEDPELTDLALRFFGSEDKAAHWFGRCRQGYGSCYTRLAAGDREGVCEQLIAAEYGMFL